MEEINQEIIGITQLFKQNLQLFESKLLRDPESINFDVYALVNILMYALAIWTCLIYIKTGLEYIWNLTPWSEQGQIRAMEANAKAEVLAAPRFRADYVEGVKLIIDTEDENKIVHIQEIESKSVTKYESLIPDSTINSVPNDGTGFVVMDASGKIIGNGTRVHDVLLMNTHLFEQGKTVGTIGAENELVTKKLLPKLRVRRIGEDLSFMRIKDKNFWSVLQVKKITKIGKPRLNQHVRLRCYNPTLNSWTESRGFVAGKGAGRLSVEHTCSTVGGSCGGRLYHNGHLIGIHSSTLDGKNYMMCLSPIMVAITGNSRSTRVFESETSSYEFDDPVRDDAVYYAERYDKVDRFNKEMNLDAYEDLRDQFEEDDHRDLGGVPDFGDLLPWQRYEYLDMMADNDYDGIEDLFDLPRGSTQKGKHSKSFGNKYKTEGLPITPELESAEVTEPDFDSGFTRQQIASVEPMEKSTEKDLTSSKLTSKEENTHSMRLERIEHTLLTLGLANANTPQIRQRRNRKKKESQSSKTSLPVPKSKGSKTL